MSREASIQLVLQNSLILYQYFRFPVIEYNYGLENSAIKMGISATSLWIIQIVGLLVSVLLCANSTFSTLLEKLEFEKLKYEDRRPTILEYFNSITRVFLHIAVQTLVVFMAVWVLNEDKRWNNLRFHLEREYGQERNIKNEHTENWTRTRKLQQYNFRIILVFLSDLVDLSLRAYNNPYVPSRYFFSKFIFWSDQTRFLG